MYKSFFSILFIVLALTVLVYTSQVIAALPQGKAFKSNDYTQDCGNGRKGSKCFQSRDIVLSWSHPTQREDSTSLSTAEISHYVISMSKDGGPTRLISVSKKTSFNLRHMPSGTYTFQISTIDTAKQQSAFSSEVQITI